MPLFEKLPRGQQTYQSTGEPLALKWMDKREVHMLTTAHEPIISRNLSVLYNTTTI
jgi:hypothetical protein